jgi:trans-aconitate methyltransferase
MEPLGRFYTSEAISGLLVSKFRQDSPQNILDIGAGDGSLLNAAYNRWKNATFHAADIDPGSMARISLQLPFVRLRHIDGLSRMPLRSDYIFSIFMSVLNLHKFISWFCH